MGIVDEALGGKKSIVDEALEVRKPTQFDNLPGVGSVPGVSSVRERTPAEVPGLDESESAFLEAQKKLGITQAVIDGKLKNRDIPLAIKIANFFTGHFEDIPDVPEIEITPEGEVKTNIPESAEMPFLRDPATALAFGLFAGARAAAGPLGKLAAGARESLGWLTGGASEVPGIAKKGVEGVVKAASEPVTAERMAKLREAGLDVPLRGEIPTPSVSPSVASAPISGSAKKTDELIQAPKEATGAVSGQSKEPWQMTREEYYKSHKWNVPGQSEEAKNWKIANRVDGKIYEAQSGETHADIVVRENLPFRRVETGFIDESGTFRSRLPTDHEYVLGKALGEGKPVPAQVLKDYPDLSIKAGQNAVQKIIAEKSDVAKAMYRDELGPVSFYWGKEGNPAKSFNDGSGISHIIAKGNAEGLNGEEIAMMMPEVIAKGKVGEVYGSPRGQRVNVTYGDHEAVLSLYRHGNEETWLLTGWKEKTPGAPGVSTNRRDYARQTFGSRSDVGARVNENITESSSGVKDKLSFAPEKDFRRAPVEEIEKAESAEMVKRSEIVDFLRQKLDVPIRTGRFRGKALGIFKIKPEVVRSKMANDIETISHEIGHALQKHLYPESMKGGVAHAPADWQIFGDELKRASTAPNKASDYGTEGFAEFIRMYVTDPKKAKTELPNFYDYFDKQLATKSPEAREILLHARDQYDKWLKQPARQRVLSQISVGEKDYKRPLSFTRLYTAAFDELHPLKKAVEAMAKAQDLKMAEDPYALARLMPGWTGKADAFLEYKPFNYKTYQFEGKSLKEILEPMKDNLDDFRAYIVSRRAVELKRRGIESGILPKDAAKNIKELHGKYGQAFKDLKDYQDRVLNYLADSGIMDKKALAKMRELNKDYVPFYRVMEEGRGAGKGTGKGLQAWSPVKRIKGSARDIVDPLESIIKNTYLYINMAEKNAVGQALVRLAAKNEGMGKYVERIPTSMQKIKVSSEEIRNYMNKLADEVGVDSLPPEIAEVLGSMDIYRKSPFQPKDNVLSVWQNGKQTLYEVHPEIARTMQALDKESTNSLMRMLSIPSRLLRAGATLTPEFMARNPVRDQWTAYIYSKYGFKPGVDLFRGITHMIGKDDVYWKWKISGGEHSMLVSMDREYLQKNLKDLMTKYGIDSPETYKYIVKHPIDTLRILSEFGEQGTRIGEFAKGVAKEGATKEGIQKAGLASREVTLDFARKGTWGKHINQLVAFWNANMQGTDKMIRAFKEAPGATAFRVGASITLPSIGLMLYNREDGRWEDIPQWQKDLFWVVIPNRISKEDWKKMSADDKAKMLSMNPATSGIYRIPKPFEVGILFGSMPERLAEYVLSHDPKAFDGYLKSMARGLSPGIMPNVAVPWYENWANKSYFFDRPIVPKSMEGLLPEYQGGPHVTETAKAISKAINRIPGADEVSSQTSPAGIENIIRGWTGGLGQHALNIVDEALKKAGVVPEKVKPSKSLSDIPFIKAFTVRYPSASAESIREFYDNYKKMDQTVSTARYLARKKFDPKEAAEVLEAGDIAQVNRVYQALQRQQQAINAINELPSVDPEEKRRLIDTVYFQMIDISRAGNEIFKKSKESRRR